MNTFKLSFFALLLLAFITVIQFKKDLFVLFEAGYDNFTTQISGNDFPITLNDATGITYTLEQPPQRIISATLATDHILSDLVSPARVVGVSRYVDYPSLSSIVHFYGKNVKRIKAEIEVILSLEPDLVFVASYSNPETVRYLLRSDIAVVRLSEFKSFNDIINNIRLVASVTGNIKEADKVITDLQARIQFVKAQVRGLERPRVLYYDLNGYSVGGNSLMNEAIETSGGINIAQGVMPDGEHKISEELAISLQPDIIFMTQWIFKSPLRQQSPVEILKGKAAWANVPAVMNNKVYAVSGTLLRSVSQHRIKGIEVLASLFHPAIQTYHGSNKREETIDAQ